MVRSLLLAAAFLFVVEGAAQPWHDAVWLFGYNPNRPELGFGGSRLDFNSTTPHVSYFDIPFDFEAISMISDSSGNLVLYTNGCQIVNAMHSTMENGDSLNAGERHDSFCEHGYPIPQGVITLPMPGHPGRYGLFHLLLNDDVAFFTDLLYTEVDALANDGAGRVDTLNKTVFQDRFGTNLSAVRHANGRDWWIITAKYQSNRYFITYYGPNGPGETYTQTIGPVWDNRYWSGQSTFSPDGSKYIRMNPYNGLHIFDFDRCTGRLSQPIHITFGNEAISSSGAAVSPNNRFLYVAASVHIYQYDLYASNIAASRQTVAVYDGFESPPPFSTTFFMLMNAPNGKIYGTAPNGVNILHVIHNPNERGLACNVEQHGILLPTRHGFATPNFPHFRLWDEAGSPCDTLGIDAPLVTASQDVGVTGLAMSVFPNPVRDQVRIAFGQPVYGRVSMMDSTGRPIASFDLDGATEKDIPTAHLPAGMYILRFEGRDGHTAQQKLMVN